jgi:2-polyprenyl-3-methyl-5-hydroxy-6-metoxy-1,4-benzoquinol methylase
MLTMWKRNMTDQCPLCKSPLGAALLTIRHPDRFELSVGITSDSFFRTWRACLGCDAAINEHQNGNAEKLHTIAKNYYEVDLGTGIVAKYQTVMSLPDDKSDNAGRVRRIFDKLMTLRSAQGLPAATRLKVADVGAGTGVFLSKLSQICSEHRIELDAIALEPDPIAAEHLRDLGITRVHEDVLDQRFQEDGFDLVVFNKVLEHIEFPSSPLSEGARILNATSGLLYAEVPDIQTIYYRPSTDNILGSLHHHLYAPRSLDGLLRRSNLLPVEIQRIVEPSGKLTVFGFAVLDRRYSELTR